MNVSLTPELEKMIAEKVASGLYRSASEVVRESLRALAEREARQAKFEALQREVQIGLDAADAGQVKEWNPAEIKAGIRRRTAQRRKKVSA